MDGPEFRKNKEIKNMKHSFIDNQNLPENIFFEINSINLCFSRIHPPRSSSGFYYVDSNKKYFLKVFKNERLESSFKNEIKILKILDKYPKHFPKIVLVGQNYFVMNYCGEMISAENIPVDVYTQVDDILNILNNEKIRHLDIKQFEVLVNNGILNLIDFGFSRVNFNEDHGPRPNDDLEFNLLIDNVVRLANKKNISPRNKYAPRDESKTDKKFVKYVVNKRKHHNASQAQSSSLTINGSIATFDGYQSYFIQKTADGILIDVAKKTKIKCEMIQSIMTEQESVLDLGCSNGAVGIWIGLQGKAKHIYLYDHDSECISNLRQLREWLVPCSMEIHEKEYVFGDPNNIKESFDYVTTLATLHWFYSATTNMGCLYKILENLRNMTRVALIVEWVNESDPMLNGLKHTKMNHEIHVTKYSRENFIGALEKNFSKYEKIGDTTNHRELFVAYV